MENNLFLILLAGYSLTFIIMHGKPLDKPRKYLVSKSPFLKALFRCVLCTGIYVGLVISIVLFILKPNYWLILLPFGISAAAGVLDAFIFGKKS